MVDGQNSEKEEEKYTTQGLPNYTAHSLSIKNHLVMGCLYKKSKSKVANFFGATQFLRRYVHVDFPRQNFSHQTNYHPDVKIKRQPFGNIVEVDFEDNSESEQNLKYRYKFSVTMVNGKTNYFARTSRERELWVETLCKIIDLNNGHYIGERESPSYDQVKQKQEKRPNNFKKSERTQLHSMRNKPEVEYSSSHMDFNYFGVQGTLYKRINNLKVFHDANFH